MKNYAVMRRELQSKLREGKLTNEDLKAAAEVAKSSSRVEDISLYAQVKRALKEGEDSGKDNGTD